MPGCAPTSGPPSGPPGNPLVLRLGVDAEGLDDPASAAQARVTASDLAMKIIDALTCTSVRQALRLAGEEDLAACLSIRSSTRDGLRRAPDQQALERVAGRDYRIRCHHHASSPIP